ncbi:MAG: prepilin-type N-terminal cleavage/methylation domain-containing protein [Planctomycetota bacterium]
MQRNAHRSAFTLIELLVVISIIALLIGILLPALGAARRSARAMASASNIRQWATGMQTYSTDNKQFLPWDGEDSPLDNSGSTKPGEALTWQVDAWYANAIPPYLGYAAYNEGTSNQAVPGSNTIFTDPAATTPSDYPGNYTATVNGVDKSYLFHYVFNSKLDEDDGASQSPKIVNNLNRLTQDMMRSASATVYMVEKRSVAEELNDFGGTADGYYTRGLDRVKGDWQRIAARHSGSGHLGFGDGHVENVGYIDATTPRDDPRVQGQRIRDPEGMNRSDRIWAPLQWQSGVR